MKNFTFLFIAVLVIFSCKKKPHNKITYPENIYYGKNILSYPDNTLFFDGTDYEMGAILEEDQCFH